MAYTTIKKPSDYFNTKLYTGNGSTQSITGVGFQPDWVWIKNRTSAEAHGIFDAVRSVTKMLSSANSDAESTDANSLTAFGSDGFSVGSNLRVNQSSNNIVSWNWKANGAGVANTDGSRETTVSANTTSGFSVGTCASLATNNDTLGHGLGVAPSMIIVKLTQASGSWVVYHASLGNTNTVYLNGTEASTTSTIWNNTTPTSSVFTMKGGDFATAEPLVFYAFAEVKGFSKFGSYVGNGNADGTFVYTGFKPAFLMVKNISTTDDWRMFDNRRPGINVIDDELKANTNGAEGAGDKMDFLSNGVKFRVSTSVNASNTFIYMAFAEQPLVGDNPATAR